MLNLKGEASLLRGKNLCCQAKTLRWFGVAWM
jgi:hypothetical protein